MPQTIQKNKNLMKQEFLLQIYYKNITFKRLSRCQFQMDNLNVWHIRSHYGTVPCSNEICQIFFYQKTAEEAEKNKTIGQKYPTA